jgi:hypothetical protein
MICPDLLEFLDHFDLALFPVRTAEMPGIMQKCLEKRIKGGVV